MKDNVADGPSFWEKLPDQCPPRDADHIVGDTFVRLLPEPRARLEYFYSHKKLNKPINPKSLQKIGECRYASCSLFELPMSYQHADLLRLPNMKSMKYYCVLSLTRNSGVALKTPKSGNPHIDMWFYSDFDIISSITKTEEINRPMP